MVFSKNDFMWRVHSYCQKYLQPEYMLFLAMIMMVSFVVVLFLFPLAIVLVEFLHIMPHRAVVHFFIPYTYHYLTACLISLSAWLFCEIVQDRMQKL